MRSQTGQQIITIHILTNTSRSQEIKTSGNKVWSVNKIQCENNFFFFFKNRAAKELGILIPVLFLVIKKALHKVNAGVQYPSFNIFWQILALTDNKNKLYNILDC